jgi:hypothetical protein
MKKVVLISSCDSLAELSCAGLFEKGKDFEIIGLVQTKVSTEAKKKLIRKAIKSGALFYLVYMFFEQNLPSLIFKIFDIFQKRAPRMAGFSQVKGSQKIPILITSDVNSVDTAQFIKDLSSDLILSVRPSQIFRRELISSCPPIMNLHCSLLPDYRGIGGILQPLAAGETYLGCSVHLVESEEIDRGPIWAQSQVITYPKKSVFFHTFMLNSQSSFVIKEAIHSFFSNKTCMPNEQGSLFSWPDRLVLAKLHRNDRCMINFNDIFHVCKFL